MRRSSRHAARHHDTGIASTDAQPSHQSTLTTNRRIVLKAAAGMAALAASGIGAVPEPGQVSVAQEAGGTRAARFVPETQGIAAADAAAGEWVTFQADFPFWAIGASWNGDVGEWPVINIQVSEDGATWSETVRVAAQTEDGGQPTRDDRLFTALVFTGGESFVRYQTTDIDGVPGVVEGLEIVYIDPTDGPWVDDLGTGSDAPLSILATNDTLAPPEVITREQWGANEDWRFADFGEIWPPEYETVTHLIIHHTATANRPVDVPGAIRAIYYYHAVEQGWGDIGYNYLVDHNGRIYQGRYGGQNVIGGHSFQFAIGSSGISVIGNFMSTDLPVAAKSALVSICAWVGRGLDPLASSDFHQAPDLPVISSHRDVNATTCPGDFLWSRLPEIRQLVNQTLEEGVLETGLPAGIVPGDRVKVQTDTGQALNLRSTANGAVIGSLPNGALAWVIDGPTTLSNGNWYRLEAVSNGATGWATAQFLIVDPPIPPTIPGALPYGLNLRFTGSANLRRGPDTSDAIIATVPANTWAHVMAGPIEADGFDWYQVRAYQVGDGWVVRDLIEPAPFNGSPNGTFQVGDFVQTTATINIRPRPGLAQGVIATAGTGTRFEITQSPVEVTGFIWYGAYSENDDGGWIAQDNLREVGPPPTGKFQTGDSIRVTSTMNLRSAPSTSASVVMSMPTGTTATVLDGPRTGSGYTWWQIRTSGGTTGWAAENWLEETTTTPPPTGKFTVGDTVRVTERLNLRSAASTAGSVIVVLNVGVTGTVLAGPSAGSGFTWYRIQTSQGTGWAVQDWLEETTTTPPPSGKFEVGDNVRVTENLNLRSSASTSGSVVMVLTAGTTGTMQGGPTSANGYTWWQIRTSGGTTGWAVENWLVEGGGTTPPPTGRFDIGDTVRVTESLRMRSSANTSAGVVAVLPAGTTGTVLAGPTTASGYTWWRIQTASGTGWAAGAFLIPM